MLLLFTVVLLFAIVLCLFYYYRGALLKAAHQNLQVVALEFACISIVNPNFVLFAIVKVARYGAAPGVVCVPGANA